MLHKWEEPFISGTQGSGAIFFSGCNLGCVFCQNYQISQSCDGNAVTCDQLRQIFSQLISMGANNINLVTPTHYMYQIAKALVPKPQVPVVYNCSGYEGDLKVMQGLCDIYLTDLKYGNADTASRYSNAPDYVQVCIKSLEEMYRQVGDYVIQDGIMKKGLVVRHLVLPSNIENTLDAIDIFARFSKGKKVKFSLMSQYIPCARADLFPEINRTITLEEYQRAINYLNRRGIKDYLIQDLDSADSGYIPEFKR